MYSLITSCSQQNYYRTPANITLENIDPPSSINIFIEPPQNGFGDIASNIYMSEIIKKRYPDAKINIFYSKSCLEKLPSLIKEFDINKTIQNINGMTYYNIYPLEELPRADILLQFSSEKINIDIINQTAPLRFTFAEFGRSHIKGIIQQKMGLSPITFDASKERLQFHLTSGIDSGGIYLSDEGTKTKLAGEEFIEKIKNLTGTDLSDYDIDKAKIGFSYVSNGKLSQIYTESIFEVAKLNENQDKQYIVFSKQGYYTNLKNRPKNVIMVKSNNLSLDLSREVISRSNIPIFITGDVSLNLAIDSEKVFFYEEQPWKKFLSKSIKENMTNFDKDLKNDLEKSLSINIEKLKDFTKKEKKLRNYFAKKINDPNYYKKFKKAVKEMKNENSLLNNFLSLYHWVKMIPKEEYLKDGFIDKINRYFLKNKKGPHITCKKTLNRSFLHNK